MQGPALQARLACNLGAWRMAPVIIQRCLRSYNSLSWFVVRYSSIACDNGLQLCGVLPTIATGAAGLFGVVLRVVSTFVCPNHIQ